MFKDRFQQLTGHSPMAWQKRLFDEYFAESKIPDAVDVPTGLGKTSVMVLWLLGHASGASLPRRLVYVVDRRAVVDQATDFAMTLRKNLAENAALQQAVKAENLPISTLRGQFADNREWLESPTALSIVVGTVDMIGSRLLFEGYGVSRKMRPYHAGFLGADSLVVLDESHLVPPFQHLLEKLLQGEVGPRAEAIDGLLPRTKVLSLSATGNTSPNREIFRFQPEIDAKDEKEDAEARRRFHSPKSVDLIPLVTGRPSELAAQRAWALSGEGTRPVRIVTFCNSRQEAQQVHAWLTKKGAAAELLVGARRVKEREEVAAKLKELGFIGSSNPPDQACFLVATSAGEVGVDIDADHAVFDLVPWERLVQRLGRVNRRGLGQASIEIVIDPKRLESDQQLEYVNRLLEALPSTNSGSRDASPRALYDLRSRTEAEVEAASTPEPLRPELTRPLLEAWSCTSLKAENPARPDVRPWIRGWTSDPIQTTVVWRRFLPFKDDQPERLTRALKTQLNRFFEVAPIHLTEGLETDTDAVVSWLLKRASLEAPAAKRREVLGYVLNAAGEIRTDRDTCCLLRRELTTVRPEAMNRLKDTLRRRLGGSVLVLDASFGGLKHGLLDSSETWEPSTIDEESAEADPSWGEIGFTINKRKKDEDQDAHSPRKSRRFVWRSSDESDDAVVLEVHPTTKRQLESERSLASKLQTLDDHQLWAEAFAEETADALGLPPHYRRMLCLVARHHDEGKRARNWQEAFNAPQDDGQVYAKTPGPIKFSVLGGYRHEMGSLDHFRESKSWLELPSDVQDLGLHLVGAHHGQGRPLIGTDGFPDTPPSLLCERAHQVAQRFARLQRRWGPLGLAWWESLLRAIDQRASSKTESFHRGEVACGKR